MNDALAGADGDGQTPVHAADLEGLRQRWIRTQGQLDEVERASLLAGARWAHSRRRSLDQLLDDAFVRELHRHAFGGVWQWAGQYRIRAASIGIEASLVSTAMRDMLADAAYWFGEGRASEEAVARLHHRFVAIHPFANGNGRTGRLFTDLVAIASGGDRPTWGEGANDARAVYLAALRAADAGDIEPLVAFMWS